MVSRKLLVLVVAAAWLAASSCDARISNVLLMPHEELISEKLTFYPIVPFDTASATANRYKSFISHAREEMGVKDKVHDIPRLYNGTDLEETFNRYIQVALYNTAGNRIVLALDRVTANVVAYRTYSMAYFFKDTSNITNNLFYGITRETLVYESSYSSLEAVAGSRTEISLGIEKLDDSIHSLFDNNTQYLARSLLVASQMIADAIRYRYVENLVVEHILKEINFEPTQEMITLEDKWTELSANIQRSLGGAIPPLKLSDTSGIITSIYPTLGLNFGVMLYVCDNCTHQREVTPIHLSGRNGLCVDLQDRLDYDGNAVILFPCDPASKTQEWTATLNGTIESKGKCLTAYRLKAERYVMIHNCTYNLPSHSDIKWEVQDSGNIVNKKFNLALNAFTGHPWSVLTVEQNSYPSRQRWKFVDSTIPFETSIKSYNGKCIGASSNYTTVQVVECEEEDIVEQRWNLYPDGTIRPSHDYSTDKLCLTYKSSTEAAGKSVIILLPCNGGEAERWRLHGDYSISDETNKNVLEINEDQQNIMLVKRYREAPTNLQIFKIQTDKWI